MSINIQTKQTDLMEIKTLLTILSLFSNLLMVQGQQIEYILRLNDKEPFKGSLKVLEVEATLIKFNTEFLKNTCTIFRYDTLQRSISRAFYERGHLLAKDSIIYDYSKGVRKTAIFENWNANGTHYVRTENYIYDSLCFLNFIREFDNYGNTYETRITNTAQGLPRSTGKYDQKNELITNFEEAEYLLDQNRFIFKTTSIISGENIIDTLVLDIQRRAEYPAQGEIFNRRGDLVEIPKLGMFYKYRYDKQGNWIKMKCFGFSNKKEKVKRKSLQAIWERKITYQPILK
jgi:hypothetical protein